MAHVEALSCHADDDDEKPRNIYSLAPLNVFHDINNTPCMCRECIQATVTSFHLAYFLYFGLRFDTCVKIRESYFFRITPSVVWQSYAILEKRNEVLKQQNLPSLQSLCYYSLTQHRPHLEHHALLPNLFKKNLKSLHASFDLMDKELCCSPGNSLFHSSTFPKFLYFHVDKYIGGFSREEMMRT